jgi:hypothetical protein
VQSAFGKIFGAGAAPASLEAAMRLLSPAEARLMGATANLNTTNTSRSRHVWLPIRFDADRPFIEWRDQWSLDEFD